MKRFFLGLFLILSIHSFAYAQVSKEIEPYIDFLEKEKLSAKSYIISLFKDKDIVIICERDHREITQYKLIIDIMSDPYFINNVGVVYTEVGDCNLNPELNTFLKNNQLNDAEIKSELLKFQRNAMSPLWQKSNFLYFIHGIYNINKTLPADKKLSMYPTDFLGLLKDSAPEKIKQQWMKQEFRDSIMAAEFIARYEELKKENKPKALVIMNSRHAFKHDIIDNNGYKSKNVGRFLFDKYPGKVTNVMINSHAQGTTSFFDLMQDGKWDAAFRYINVEDRGFNLLGSPFGKNRLDYAHWMLVNNSFLYQDVFDGFVFYQALKKFEIGTGVDGLMDDGFYEEYERRAGLLNSALNRTMYPIDQKEQVMLFNKMIITPLDDLESLEKKIEKWLK